MIPKICCLLCLIFILSAVPNATSQAVELEKRRIGMRLPNMVHLKPLVDKRRIGMRLPNIVYLRSEPEKKNIWEYASLSGAQPTLPPLDVIAINDALTRGRRELHNLFAPFWMTSRRRAFPIMLHQPTWIRKIGKRALLQEPQFDSIHPTVTIEPQVTALSCQIDLFYYSKPNVTHDQIMATTLAIVKLHSSH